MQKELKEVFQKLRHHPGWNVKRGWGSFITFEFGNPYLDKCKIYKRTRTRIGKNIYPIRSRPVHVKGEWYLWIECCAWYMWQDGRAIAHSNSPNDDIDRACYFLSGQKIRGIAVFPKTGKSIFSFELGGAILTRPYSANEVQWMLYCPKKILIYRSDGHFAYTRLRKHASPRRKNESREIKYRPAEPAGSKLIAVGRPPLNQIPLNPTRLKAFAKMPVRSDLNHP